MVRIRSIVAVAVAATLTVSTSACQDQGEEKAARPPEPAITLPQPEPGELPDQNSRLGSYDVSENDRDLIFQAIEKATQTCMQKKGFVYQIDETAWQRPAVTTQSRDPDNLGLVSEEAAATTGYHQKPKTKDNAPKDNANRALPDLDSDYMIALQGSVGKAGDREQPGQRGCRGEADGRLKGAEKGAPKILVIDQIRQKSYEWAMADSRVKSSKSTWSTCMSKKGYKYRNPAEPVAAAWPDPVGRAEIDTAVADMACKKEARMLGTWIAVLTAYQDTLTQENEAALQGVKENTAARVARAKAILQEPSS